MLREAIFSRLLITALAVAAAGCGMVSTREEPAAPLPAPVATLPPAMPSPPASASPAAPGKGAYPISSFTWLLVPVQAKDPC